MRSWIDVASQLPLPDAAFLLLIRTIDVDNWLRKQVAAASTNNSVPDLKYSDSRRAFTVLRAIRQDVTDDELHAAVERAKKFWMDCCSNYRDSAAGLVSDAHRAVDLALPNYPGFLKETRNWAIDRLCFENR
ncbi:hypothetical protein [Nitrospirillum amazonense]|uniref:hypothetical protein n=1 Tax=Nitrospirillum amazonense TaxID=28077 RepID=UPI002412B107|nr:hypothetical protein [Nitrospirillum amazonense]MDG3443655.1 hypothetical protein [Nitrospirillum amazonense]